MSICPAGGQDFQDSPGLLPVMPNRLVRDKWDYPRKMERHFFCDLRDTGAMLDQLSCEATLWERGQLVEFKSFRAVK